MLAKRLREFLNSSNVTYMTMPYAVAYAAKEIAALTHISNKELAKTVIVKVDGTMAMGISCPAQRNRRAAASRLFRSFHPPL